MNRGHFNAATAVAATILMLACGKTRNVLDAAPSDDGESGVSAGSAGSAGRAGATSGTGGQVTWSPRDCHVTPVPEPVDPSTKEQWRLARAYCVALGEQNCFTSGAVASVGGCTTEEALEACVAQVLWYHHQSVSAACEDVWRKDLDCGAKSTFPVSCEGANAFGYTYGSAQMCAQENAALLDCAASHSVDIEVAGSYTTCSYSLASSSAACMVNCQVGAQYNAGLNCWGPEGLPQQCGCLFNGHVVIPPQPIFVNDCADAAGQAADGLCTSLLDCCFEYQEGAKPACRCDDPAEYGYDSCEAMMTVAQGQRVDICPELLPDLGGCWPPGSCPLP